MAWLDCLIAGGTLVVLLIPALIGAVRPDRIYAFQYWWATYWSRRVLGNADKVQRRYARVPPRSTLMVLRVYSIMGLVMSASALFLMIVFGDCGRILMTAVGTTCQSQKSGGTLLVRDALASRHHTPADITIIGSSTR